MVLCHAMMILLIFLSLLYNFTECEETVEQNIATLEMRVRYRGKPIFSVLKWLCKNSSYARTLTFIIIFFSYLFILNIKANRAREFLAEAYFTERPISVELISSRLIEKLNGTPI